MCVCWIETGLVQHEVALRDIINMLFYNDKIFLILGLMCDGAALFIWLHHTSKRKKYVSNSAALHNPFHKPDVSRVFCGFNIYTVLSFLICTSVLPMIERKASVSRDTLETQITVAVDLDGTGVSRFDTPVPFLEHMLDQISRHGLIDIDVKARGDIAIDAHHSVEDVGITLGQAFSKAIGDKKGIRRYGHAYVPLDEALSRVVVDFSGRPHLEMHVDFTRPRVGDFDVDLFREFFQGFVNHAQISLHIDNLRGRNTHHQIETIFKAFGRALRMALEFDSRMAGMMPSTKGTL